LGEDMAESVVVIPNRGALLVAVVSPSKTNSRRSAYRGRCSLPYGFTSRYSGPRIIPFFFRATYFHEKRWNSQLGWSMVSGLKGYRVIQLQSFTRFIQRQQRCA